MFLTAVQNEAGEPTDPPSAGSAPDGNTAATGTPSSMQLTVVREKNRIAQRKYRAKQRQRQNESSSKIAELTRKLAEMQRKQVGLLCTQVCREAAFGSYLAPAASDGRWVHVPSCVPWSHIYSSQGLQCPADGAAEPGEAFRALHRHADAQAATAGSPPVQCSAVHDHLCHNTLPRHPFAVM